mgnify:CR=1 FL=1
MLSGVNARVGLRIRMSFAKLMHFWIGLRFSRFLKAV